MKRIVLMVLGVLAVSTSAYAQTTAEISERALAAAPGRAREGVAVIKWNADYTYETLKEGTNWLFCYDRSGEPGRQPFAVQCTSVGNLDRVAQNRRFEAESENAEAMQAMLDAAEADGTRVKPEHLHEWPGSGECADTYDDRRAGRHHRVDRPTRHSQAEWCMDHGCRHDDRSYHDTGPLRSRPAKAEEAGELRPR